MSYFEESVKVTSFKKEKESIYSVWFRSKKITENFVPGKFINISVNDKNSITPVLRRPFAIASVKGDEFEVIFHIKGRGTEIFSNRLEVGAEFNVLGPLG